MPWAPPVVVAMGAVVLIVLVRLLVPDHGDYLAIGDWSAPVCGLGWLGVGAGETWASVGPTFLVIITVVTGIAMWLHRSPCGRPCCSVDPTGSADPVA